MTGRRSPRPTIRKAPTDNKAVQPRLVSLQRDAAVAFLEADVNGDAILDYEEFKSACPKKLKEQINETELREIFDSVDHDQSGGISMDEYFLWALSVASENTGSGIEAVFRKYDKDNEGSLDAMEFSRAVEDMGFGSMAHELFLELDKDGSGSVAYSELEDMLRQRRGTVGRNAKLFLTSLAFDRASGDGTGLHLDPSNWKLSATTVGQLRTQLQEKLLEVQRACPLTPTCADASPV